VQRLALVAVALVALATPANGRASLFFLFDRPSASPNDRVTVRTVGTPQDFKLGERVKPLQRPVRVYLVRIDVGVDVRSRFDQRLNFAGPVVLDKKGRGLLTFSVPPLDPGILRARVLVPRLRHQESQPDILRPAPPLAGAPAHQRDAVVPGHASQREHATGSAAHRVLVRERPPLGGLTPDGVYAVPQDRVGGDGSIGDKLLSVTTPPWRAPTISGERLDTPAPPLRVSGANQGSFDGADKPSFMTPVSFPTTGC
jgi:hypothetical protein